MPKLVRRIDLTPVSEVSAATLASTDNPAPPALASIPVPQDLALTTVLGRSAVTPTALVRATWEPPLGVEPQGYALQISESSSFPTGNVVTIGDIRQPSTTIEGLKTAATYYVRVAAVYRGVQSDWTEVTSTNGVDMITTPPDTVPASAPTSAAAAFVNAGDLRITWTNPTEPNFRVVEVRIYSDSSKTTHYHTAESATGAYTFTAAQNGAATGYLYDNSLYVELLSLTYGGVYSSTAATASATKALPATPGTIVQSWSGDSLNAGTAGPDWSISWGAVSDAARYVLTIDGKSIPLTSTRCTYSLDANRADHSGTPDPVLSYSLVAYDALNQASASAASGTATNHNPPTTSVALTAGFSAVAISATPSTAADLRDYTFRIIKDSSTLATYRSSSPDQVYQATARGSYQVGVTVNDVFGQASTETVSSAVTLDALTIGELRSEAIYTDSIGTDFTSGSNATVLKDDATGAGITYAISASAYRWTQLERPFRERYRRVSIKCGTGGASFYLATSQDGTTWRWFAGTGVDGYTMVERADEATAQANVSLTTSLVNGWIELPVTVEARYVRLYHRNTGVSYRLDEFYAYTLVVADMIRAGDIQAIHIGAGQVTADKISVLSLSAISADMGSITAGTITGATIRTSSSGARVVLSSDTNGGLIGYSASDTYNPASGAGTYQVLWLKADGKLYSGGGVVVQDANGIGITGDTFSYNLVNLSAVTVLRANAIEWTVTSGQKASISGSTSGQLLARGQKITLAIPISSTANYGVNLQSSGAHLMTASSFSIAEASATAPNAFSVTAALTAAGCSATARGGFNVGSATGAAEGEIKTSGDVMVGGGTVAGGTLAGLRVGLGADCYLSVSDGTRTLIAGVASSVGGIVGTLSNHDLEVRTNNTKRMVFTAAGLWGMFGATPVAQQTGGAMTADGTYSATERDMINAMWTALRNYGLLT